jgi:cytochrome P450
MEHKCPVILDVDGLDIQAEGARLRDEGPVRLVEMPGGVRAWAIAGADVQRRLLMDPRVSKDPRRHWKAWRDGDVADDWPLRIWVSVQNMFTAYGTEHRRLRSLASSAFTARRTAALRPGIEDITRVLLDRIANLPTGQPVDLRATFAYPLQVDRGPTSERWWTRCSTPRPHPRPRRPTPSRCTESSPSWWPTNEPTQPTT